LLAWLSLFLYSTLLGLFPNIEKGISPMSHGFFFMMMMMIIHHPPPPPLLMMLCEG